MGHLRGGVTGAALGENAREGLGSFSIKKKKSVTLFQEPPCRVLEVLQDANKGPQRWCLRGHCVLGVILSLG